MAEMMEFYPPIDDIGEPTVVNEFTAHGDFDLEGDVTDVMRILEYSNGSFEAFVYNDINDNMNEIDWNLFKDYMGGSTDPEEDKYYADFYAYGDFKSEEDVMRYVKDQVGAQDIGIKLNELWDEILNIDTDLKLRLESLLVIGNDEGQMSPDDFKSPRHDERGRPVPQAR